MAGPTYKRLRFDDLNGWAADDHSAAFAVFRVTSPDLTHPAGAVADPRNFFETHFDPVLVTDGAPMLFTGYFEPELQGARQRGGPYQHPVYALPDDLKPGAAYLTRRQIEDDMTLADKGLELAWLADPVDVFFLQVQGSGRICLPDGDLMRVGFAGKNGRDYSSVGKALIKRGIFTSDQVSATAIRNWIRQNPDAGRALLWENASYVFFREVSEIPAHLGPLGAMQRSITAGRSIAVDPAFTPLGAPVWVEKQGDDPIHRLMIAQDTGSAIKGAQRADIFFGTGDVAGRTAGSVKDGGRMIVLLPKGQV
ncbi:murein transglycosylase A [Yoonia sp.]|uniref:murein transglycosylase A n=1 Tax=Yoonia sp. TaxID=2212373 RepID=UPI003F6D23F7